MTDTLEAPATVPQAAPAPAAQPTPAPATAAPTAASNEGYIFLGDEMYARHQANQAATAPPATGDNTNSDAPAPAPAASGEPATTTVPTDSAQVVITGDANSQVPGTPADGQITKPTSFSDADYAALKAKADKLDAIAPTLEQAKQHGYDLDNPTFITERQAQEIAARDTAYDNQILTRLQTEAQQSYNAIVAEMDEQAARNAESQVLRQHRTELANGQITEDEFAGHVADQLQAERTALWNQSYAARCQEVQNYPTKALTDIQARRTSIRGIDTQLAEKFPAYDRKLVALTLQNNAEGVSEADMLALAQFSHENAIAYASKQGATIDTFKATELPALINAAKEEGRQAGIAEGQRLANLNAAKGATAPGGITGDAGGTIPSETEDQRIRRLFNEA